MLPQVCGTTSPGIKLRCNGDPLLYLLSEVFRKENALAGGGAGTHVRHWGMRAHLDEELLAGGPLLPSKLARPGPVRAPSPPTGVKRCVLETPPVQLGRN